MPSIRWVGPVKSDAVPELTVQFDELHQRFDGIGGSFMRAGATLLNAMSEDVQHKILEALFHPIKGAGFTLGKVPIGATDFGVPSWYTYADSPQSSDLPQFSIDHDLDPVAGFIPFVRRAAAAAGRPLRLQATMDYPPAWMINSTVPLPGATLNTTLLPALAQYYLKYADALADAGVPLDFLSLFNELTDSYMNATYASVRDLLVDHVAPLFAAEAAARGNVRARELRSSPDAVARANARVAGTTGETADAEASASAPPPKLTWTEKFGRRITAEASPSFYQLPGVAAVTGALFYHGWGLLSVGLAFLFCSTD